MSLAQNLENPDTLQSAAPEAALTEFDLGYYGWRVVLAACLGVMAGFGSLFVYTFAVFVKPLGAEFGWSREAVSRGFGLAAVTLGLFSPLLGRWIDRFGPRSHHFTVHDGVWLRHCFAGAIALRIVAVLPDLHRAGPGWERCRPSGLFAVHFHLVSAPFGTGPGLRDGGSGLGRHDPAGVCANHHQSIWLEGSLRVTGWFALLLGLPLSWRYIRERGSDPARICSVAHSGMTWPQGLRSFAFWIIVAILFVSSISMNGAITQLSALLTDRGITAGGAALCASMLGGSSLLGRIGWAGCWTDFSGRASPLP